MRARCMASTYPISSIRPSVSHACAASYGGGDNCARCIFVRSNLAISAYITCIVAQNRMRVMTPCVVALHRIGAMRARSNP
ncbi:bacteriophage replication A domain protein [Burkholderia pseudomallei]|nr:bacteriophage replication A domain protein [Burkholderia pseudomallei]